MKVNINGEKIKLLQIFVSDWKQTLGFFGFASFLSALLILASCENDPQEVQDLMAHLETDVEVADSVEIIYSDSAIIQVKVRAPKVLYHLDKNEPIQEFPEGLIVDFYNPNGQKNSMLTAKYSIRNERWAKVTVRDSVVWQDIFGEKLETAELIWEEKKKRIHTNKFVVITRPDEILYGHGLEAEDGFKDARIKAFKGRIKIKNQFDEK